MTHLSKEVESAVARSRVYHDLSSLFHYPSPETWELLHGGQFIQGLTQWNSLVPNGLFEAPSQKLTSLLSSQGEQDLLQEYQRVFGHTMSEEYPLYETQYSQAHIFMQTQGLADIAGFYKAFGLSVGGQDKERLDHLSVELEFMSFLAYKEAYARTHHTEEQVKLCRDAQTRFLEDHLGRWVPAFITKLRAKVSDGIYPELVLYLQWFVESDARYLGATPTPLRSIDTQMAVPELEGSSPCNGCNEADSCPSVSNSVFEERK